MMSNNTKQISLMVKSECFKFKDAGFTQQEIADILGISKMSVRRILKRGIEKIQVAIQAENRYIDHILYSGEILDIDDPTFEGACEIEYAEQFEETIYNRGNEK